MNPYRHLETERRGDVVILRFTDAKLQDSLVLAELRDESLAAADEFAPQKLLVDFSQVMQGSTAVINCLLALRKRMQERAGRMALCGLQSNVRASFQILNLDGPVFDIHEELEDGLEALAG